MAFAPKLLPQATRADLEALPRTWRGELIDGTMCAFPRPSFEHANIEGMLVADLLPPFQRGKDGPGGWWILPELGIELPRAPEFSPDVAGWRKTTLPAPPARGAAITVVPDWVCEILSPSTASYDSLIKRRFYAASTSRQASAISGTSTPPAGSSRSVVWSTASGSNSASSVGTNAFARNRSRRSRSRWPSGGWPLSPRSSHDAAPRPSPALSRSAAGSAGVAQLATLTGSGTSTAIFP